MNIILLILFGLIGGIVGGMGMGGGTLTIPLLVIFGGVEQHLAQSINLIIFLPMAIIALIIHCKNGLVEFKKSFLIIIPAVLTAIGGSLLSQLIPNDELRLYFGIFIGILGIIQFISVFFMKTQKKRVSVRSIIKIKNKKALNSYHKKI